MEIWKLFLSEWSKTSRILNRPEIRHSCKRGFHALNFSFTQFDFV